MKTAWHDKARDLLMRVRQLKASPRRLQDADLIWLNDLQDLYELGILERVGVAGGLGRPLAHLKSMLRTSQPVTVGRRARKR